MADKTKGVFQKVEKYSKSNEWQPYYTKIFASTLPRFTLM